MSNNLSITMLQEMGDTAYFRLPDLPELPKPLRGGRVMSAGKIAKMIMYSIMVLKAADQDTLAAQNEFRMAKHAPNEGERNGHMRRVQVLNEQASLRRQYSDARIDAAWMATAI